MKFGFIGAGKVGFSLGKYLAERGFSVSGYSSRSLKNAEDAAEFTGSKAYSDIETLVRESDIIFLTVPDGAIKGTWSEIRRINESSVEEENKNFLDGKILCHCSGVLSSDVFDGISLFNCLGYSIHPLFAFSDKRESYRKLSGIYFTIEGSKSRLTAVKSFIESLGNPVLVIDKKDKVKYHCAAVYASNFIVGLLGNMEKILSETSIGADDLRAFEPIIRGNIDNVLDRGAVAALTGPVERADVGTISMHLDVLSGEDRALYIQLCRSLVDIASRKNPGRDYKNVIKLLSEEIK